MTGKQCKCPDRFRSVAIRGLRANVQACNQCGHSWLEPVEPKQERAA